MSPRGGSGGSPGPELAATFAATRVAIVVLCGFVVLFSLVQAVGIGSSLTPVQVVATAAAAGLIALALTLNGATTGAWLAVASVTVLVISVAADPPESGSRVQVTTALFLISYFGVLLLSRMWGLLWVALSCVLWLLIAAPAPLPITLSDVVVNVRPITLLQLVVSSLWLWWAWHTELGRVEARDVRAQRSEASVVESITLQERIRAWRRLVVRTHETVLNDLRYVLDSDIVDRGRLAEQMAQRREFDAGPPVPPIPRSLQAVVDSVGTAERLGTRLTTSIPATVMVASDQGTAVQAALTEAIRNAIRHAGATEVAISATVEDEGVRLRVVHDGVPKSGASEPGIGTAIVIREGVEAVGGRVAQLDGILTLWLPTRDTAAATVHTTPPVEPARVVMSSIAAGNAMGGAPYYLLVAVVGGVGGLVAGIAAGSVALLGAYALRHRQVRPLMLVVTSVLSVAALVALVQGVGGTCDEASVWLTTAILVVFGSSAVVLWARPRWWWLMAVPTLSAAAVMLTFLPSCAEAVTLNLGSIIAAPVCLVLVLLSLRVGARRAAKMEALNRAEARERAGAAAESEISEQLRGAVDDATRIMEQIAAGAPADDAVRNRLRCLDGEIRATLQVSASTPGGFARAALGLVRQCGRIGIPVRVQTIRDSGDHRALPESLVSVLSRLLSSTDGEPPSILVLANSREDTLSITTTGRAMERAGLSALWRHDFPHGHAEIDYSEASDRAVVLVHRTVEQQSIAAAPTG